jgi:hypothetical protein
VLAYLACVTGIVGALAISFVVFFSTPNQPTMPIHTTAMATKPSAAKTLTAMEAKPAAKSATADNHIAADFLNSEPFPHPTVAPDARRKTQMARAQLRRLVQEERAKRRTYQQDSDFETRFLGYAD